MDLHKMNAFGDTKSVKAEKNGAGTGARGGVKKKKSEKVVDDFSTDLRSILFKTMDDEIFKLWMGDPRICSLFLESLLGKKIEIREIHVGEEEIGIGNTKTIVVDIEAQDVKYSIYNVEAQKISLAGYRDRCLYYSSKLVNKALKKGEDYTLLKPVVVIFINVENRFATKFIHSFKYLDEETHEVMTDKSRVIEINLSKFDRSDDNALLKVFVYFCIYGWDEEKFVMICDKNGLNSKLVGELVQALRIVKGSVSPVFRDTRFVDEYKVDEGVVKMFDASELFRDYFKEKIEKAGEARGEARGKISLIKNLSESLTSDEISKLTKLSLDFVKEVSMSDDIEGLIALYQQNYQDSVV